MNSSESRILKYFQFLESCGWHFNTFIGIICTIAIGAFDVLAPDEATHSFLYLLPISFVTWLSGIRPGMVIVVLCASLWSINNINDSPLITAWNIGSTVLFFAAIATLLHKTHNLWENERNLARTDTLTGARNLRAFSELVEYEMLCSRRDGLPFSVAYIDLDNFKSVNDNHGHAAGDDLLRITASVIIANLRTTDIVGRLGGDEFAIFFPATDGAAVREVIQKILGQLTLEMGKGCTPVTFSLGVVTCPAGVYNFDQLISQADQLMYKVKRNGKNNIVFTEYPALEPANH